MKWKLTLFVAIGISVCLGAAEQRLPEYRPLSESFAPTNTFSDWTAASTNLSVKMAAPPWGRSVTGKVFLNGTRTPIRQ
jgi:hypothetical protein